MIVKPGKRSDWFSWRDPPLDWCQANADLPGLQPGLNGAQMFVDFHVSHLPCVPHEVRDLAVLQMDLDRSLAAAPLLRPYQQTDRYFLAGLHGALLAYSMRLGKTALACHLHNPRSGILVIVGPLAAREAWRDWVGRTFNTGLVCLEGRTNVEPQPGYPAYFCHFDILAAHSAFFQSQRIGTLVLDEVHLLQARRSQRMSAVSIIAPKAGKLLGLSGTPMWNKPISLYPILHTLMPGAWGTRFTFAKRYCDAQPGAHGWTYDGVSNVEELQARLAQVMVRRTWAEVMPDLPPTTRIIETVELTGAQLTTLEAAAMKASLAQGTSNEAGYNATLRRKMAAVKIAPAVEDARRAAADGHKVVLWCWHNEIADKVAAALADKAVFRLRSSDAPAVREARVQSFRFYPEPCFMVANLGVGGVSLDLSCSDYAIFVEVDWTPANVSQPEMRTFHKDRPHVVVYFQADCSTDAALFEALDIKNGFAAAVGLGAADVMKKVFA